MNTASLNDYVFIFQEELITEEIKHKIKANHNEIISDADLVLQAFFQLKEECFKHLCGAFSFISKYLNKEIFVFETI